MCTGLRHCVIDKSSTNDQLIGIFFKDLEYKTISLNFSQKESRCNNQIISSTVHVSFSDKHQDVK